jgi:threonine dehydrogenase-like Zn-dependent dehydrogenase|tara:strand:- start:238 stop:1368 length:1131 start_codon:yes stop_codon:yes gene_type:complete
MIKNRFVKSVVLEAKGKLSLKSFPYPELKKNCAIIRMEHSGICGTDKHSFEGFFHQKGGRPIPLPVIQGHENVGVIEEINGELLDHDGNILKIGDRVVPAPNISCGKCFACRNNRPYYYCDCKLDYGNNIGAGEPPHIFGGWSEYLYILPGSHLFKYPDTLDPKFGTFIEPLSVTGCLDKARQWSSEWEPFRSGDTVVILGTGPIGLFHLIKANLMGAGKIISIDPYKYRTSLAQEFGATETVTSDDREEIKDNIKKLTNNVGADLVVDCSGVSEGFTIALELIREGGMVLEVGIFSNSHDISINPHSHILEKSARVIGIGGDDISQYYPSIKLLERNIDKLPWKKIISHEFNIDNVHEAMDIAMSDISMKVLLNP